MSTKTQIKIIIKKKLTTRVQSSGFLFSYVQILNISQTRLGICLKYWIH